MLFKDKHIELIRSGEKTVTRRVWKPNYPRPIPGNVYPAVTDFFTPREETDCWVQVPDDYERGYQERLGEMTDEDAQREGDYATVEEFKNEGWIPLYGEWDPELLVDVVPLNYVGREPPGGV